VQFNLIYDQSVASAPAGFVEDVQAVANFYSKTFTDPITITLNVGFGEVGNSALPSGALGASSTNLVSTSYKTLVSALKADATSSADHSAVASLPTRDPTGFGFYWLSTAEGKALGLYSGTGADGSIGFSASPGVFDYSTSGSVSANSYDFTGVVAHEFSEVMGRLTLDGGQVGYFPHSFMPLDLFHFSASHVRSFSATKAGYFSVDNGVTHLENFNTNPAGDSGDWLSTSGAKVDAFNAFAVPGQMLPVSSADLTVLDAIGWNLSPTATTTISGGAVSSGQLAAGGAEGHSAASGDLVDAAVRSALLGVGKGLLNSHLATSVDYFYGA
jgi:hypothetical protein